MNSQNKNCLICQRIELIKKKKNPYFIKEFETGYAVLGDLQFFKGYCLLLCKLHKKELHELDKKFRMKFLKEMVVLAEAIYKAFKPKKLNYELLGNNDEHLHWHIFPRYSNDPNPKTPIWCIDKNIRCSEKTKPSKKEIETLKRKILKEIK